MNDVVPAGDPAKNGEGEGNDPVKNVTPSTAFDPSSISDEDLPKILEDKRLWNHPRIKGLNERAKKADQYESEKEAAETQRLVEEKKFQELADKEKLRADELEAKYKAESLNNRITVAAAKLGVTDPADVLALLDRSGISVDGEGNITGVDEAVAKLLESKPYLKGDSSSAPNLGSGANPTNPNAPKKQFKMSQLQDPKFYEEHKDEIAEAYRTGGIIDDLSGRS